MDKRMFAKLLGEVYRTQRRIDPLMCSTSMGRIYGLLNGIEDAVNDELEGLGFVSAEKMDALIEVIDPIFRDRERLDAFRGYYSIEHHLNNAGIDRATAIRLFTYLKAEDRFVELIEKMDSDHSPIECRRFEVHSEDQ